jgi:hypothetical protein
MRRSWSVLNKVPVSLLIKLLTIGGAAALPVLIFNLFSRDIRPAATISTPRLQTPPTIITTASGTVNITASPMDERYLNPWTPALEEEFQQRANQVIRYYADKNYGNTTSENEKRSYPRAMFDFLAGNRVESLAFLQREDDQAKEHRHTAGIDYYYSFTLKGQIRKYFFFGSFLDSRYRQRMFDGAKTWTAQDPYDRPHPLYGNGDGSGKDWSISKRGGWVDKRNTDNLRAMREVAVYLMAEETGNEAVRQEYKQKIERYVRALYHIGMGEWDSTTYHGHTFAAYLNLYDFARDPETRLLGKAALDWLSAAAAVKYYRGGFGGPSKRDPAGSNHVFSSDSARLFWLYFGDAPMPNPDPEVDSIHVITSAYRPPQAVVALARKRFPRPVELLSTKPIYENWKQGGDENPAYWETTYFGRTYQMGSVVAAFSDRDVAPFKLIASNSKRGVDYFVANTGEDWVKPGKNSGDQIGQFRNLLIWLRPATEEPFLFQLPKSAKTEVKGCDAASGKGTGGQSNPNNPPFNHQKSGSKTAKPGTQPTILERGSETTSGTRSIAPQKAKAKNSTTPAQCTWFFRLEETWLAVYPINLRQYAPVTIPEKRFAEEYRDEATLKAMAIPGQYAGFALEVGELGTHGSYAAFKQAVMSRSQLQTSGLVNGSIHLTGMTGDRLRLTHNPNNDLPIVSRNGDRYDWQQSRDLYKPAEGNFPISLGWKTGKLRIEAGGLAFETSLLNPETTDQQ